MTRSVATGVAVALLVSAIPAASPAMAQSKLYAPSHSVREVLTAKSLYQSGPIIVHAQALFLEHGIAVIDDECLQRCNDAVGLDIPSDVQSKLNGHLLPNNWQGHLPDNHNRLYIKMQVIVIYKRRPVLTGRPPAPLSVAGFRLVDIISEGRRRFR